MQALLIAIPVPHRYTYAGFSDRETTGRVQAIRETWWKSCKGIDARFFYGGEGAREPLEDEVFLDCPDSYQKLPYKMRAIYEWALRLGYRHIFKADDDTFVYIDRLLKTGFESYDQLGFSDCTHGLSRNCECYITGGPGYFLSNRAMRAVANEPIKHWAEDWTVGLVMRRNEFLKRKAHEGFLPGFDKHYVDIDEILASGKEYVSLHAVRPEGMRRLWENL